MNIGDGHIGTNIVMTLKRPGEQNITTVCKKCTRMYIAQNYNFIA